MNLFNLDNYSKDKEGIRLQKLEVYNWGIFDQQVWNFTPEGKTALLTGDSGSGKSTIVDALTTLLVPPRKISYNKAADASARERNPRSYVLGYYGRKYAFEGKGKPEALRDTNCYSVILATFKNYIDDSVVTLAMFLWFKDNESSPTKMYVVADRELFINKDFSSFNSSIKNLKSRLKDSDCLVFNDYKTYAQHYRKKLGNITEQAIDLFQQTISMKKVDALNDFVRESMLEYEDVEPKINDLLKHYENLNTAYETVVNTRKQIEQLDPICSKGKKYSLKNEQKSEMDKARLSMECWFANKNKELISSKIEVLNEQKTEIADGLNIQRHREEKTQEDITQTKNAISQNGGDELERLTREIKYLSEDLNRKNLKLTEYNALTSKLDLKSGFTSEDYYDNAKMLPQLIAQYSEEKEIVQSSASEVSLKIQTTSKQIKDTEAELDSLQNRSSNIPGYLVNLRDKLCNALNINKELIPFAGELLEVSKNDSKWEGAIERLTYSFAISLLVPKDYYAEVANWVNTNSLGAKLVYFNTSKLSSEQVLANNKVNTVSSKLIVKSKTVFTKWLENEISNRFSHICCENIEEFKKEKKAISITGQIKSNIRHEKDDRRKVDDRTRYVLGFSNKRKIEVLLSVLEQHKNQYQDLVEKRHKFNTKYDEISIMFNVIDNIKQINSFEDIDVSAIENRLKDYKSKANNLQKGNSVLNSLKQQLKEYEVELVTTKSKIEKLLNTQGGLNNELERFEKLQNVNNEKLQLENDEIIEMYSYIESKMKKFIGNESITIENSAEKEKQYSKILIDKCNKLQKELSNLQSDIEKSMSKFRSAYPSESMEMSESIFSLEEYSTFYEKLLYHNLPMYQENFKKELHGKIIQHISIFHAHLSTFRKKIQVRIEEINDSLRGIDYNSGRFIEIICEDTPETETKLFRTHLKACTEGMISGVDEDDVAESKFMQIKKIIERFKGRANSVEVDKRWMKKVTDVRNWFVFSASERWRDSGEEYEHYSDSDGKSGGQKEKLAYTILAASLAYNYRVRDVSNNTQSFRLVVIDEAFLKSSDESAKFGLSLFKQMNFQLLVVTPLLKIATIEPFVSHVGFVSHSDITHTSTIQNISKEVFRENLLNKGVKSNARMD